MIENNLYEERIQLLEDRITVLTKERDDLKKELDSIKEYIYEKIEEMKAIWEY